MQSRLRLNRGRWSQVLVRTLGLFMVLATLAAAPSARADKRAERVKSGLRYANYLMLVEHDYDGAITEYQRILKWDRKNYTALQAIAEAEGQLGRWREAVLTHRKLVKAAPRDRAGWYRLGRALAKTGDREGALDAYRNALSLDRNYDLALVAAGDIVYARYRSKKDKALRAEVVDLYSRYLAATHKRRGFDAARVERIVAEMGDDPVAATFLDARRLYARAFTTKWRMHLMFEQSYAKLEQALKENPSHAPSLYYEGLIHLSVKSKKLHDPARAVGKFRAAGDYAPALTALGRYERTQDELEAAAKDLRRATEVASDYQPAWYELGLVLKLTDRRKEATQAFRTCVDADANSETAAKAVVELARLAPNDRRVLRHLQANRGSFKGDVFGSEKYKGSIRSLEGHLGGVDATAPEQVWLDAMMRRLLDASELKVPTIFEIKVVKTKTVNAFAVPNGTIYFTRGFLDFIKKNFPDQPQSAENAVIAAVMGHEITHITKEHVIRSAVFKQSVTSGSFNPSSLVSVTRTHEIEADREGMKLMFLAGYDPRWAVRLHEAYAQVLGEVPSGLDHPTFDERIHYLEDYWSNEMAFAYASFSQGVMRLQEAAPLEATDLNQAAKLYREAIDDFRRFSLAFLKTPESLNNLGLAHAKLGLFQLAKTQPKGALSRWYTEFSVEPKLALEFVPLASKRTRRGAAKTGAGVLPAALRRARTLFDAALQKAPNYTRARLNLAVVLLASGEMKAARTALKLVVDACTDNKICGVDSGRVQNLLGIVRAEQGHVEDAVKHFEESLRDAPQSEQAPPRVFNMARALARTGAKAKARELYRNFLAGAGQRESSWTAQAKSALKALGQ